MNLIGSVNIQMAKDNSEVLLSFAQPKTNRAAMDAAKKSIKDDCGRNVVDVRRNRAIAEPNLWCALNSDYETIAWITLNEVTVIESNPSKLDVK